MLLFIRTRITNSKHYFRRSLQNNKQFEIQILSNGVTLINFMHSLRTFFADLNNNIR